MKAITTGYRVSGPAVASRNEVCSARHVGCSAVAARPGASRPLASGLGSRQLGVQGRSKVRSFLQPCKVVQHERCSTPSTPLTLQAAGQVVHRLYDALNKRDLSSVTALLAEDCVYDNLALHSQLHGKIEVATFYADAIMAVPDEARFLVEGITGSDTYQAGVVWRLILKDSDTLMSRGISFYSLNEDGHIEHVVDNPEHAVKLSQAGVALMTPFVRNFTSPVLPKVKELKHVIDEQADRMGLTPFLDHLRGTSSPRQRSLGIQRPRKAIPERAASLAVQQRATYQAPSSPALSRPVSAAATGRITLSQANAVSAVEMPAAAASSNGDGGIREAVSTVQAIADVVAVAAPAQEAATLSAPAAVMPQAAATATAPAPAAPAPAAPAPAAPAPAAAAVPAAEVTAGPASSPAVVASALLEPLPQAASAPRAVELSGLWAKDAARTDTAAFERCLDVMRLSGLQKVTARLIEGLDLKQTGAHFEVNFVTIVPFFRVTERVPFGSSTQLGRRDLRSGKQTATAHAISNGVQVDMEWGAPYAGSLKEEYTLLEDGALSVISTTTIGADSCTVRQMYVRSAVSKEAFLQQSRTRNGSYNDVMKNQEQRFGK